MGKGVTQALKQWGSSDLPLNPQPLRPILSPPFHAPFPYGRCCINAEMSYGIAPCYTAAENEWQTKSTKGVIPCCS